MKQRETTGPIVVGILLFVGLLFLGSWLWQVRLDHNKKQEQIAQAKAMIAELESCPEEQMPELLHRPDPWGNDFLVKYNDGFVKGVTFICAGPDGKTGTKDDLKGGRHTKLDWTAGGEVIGEVGGDLGKGIWRGLKRSLIGEKKDEGK